MLHAYALALAMFCSLAFAAGPAEAKNDKHHRHDHPHAHGGDVIIAIPAQDRVIINQYIVKDARKHCPPGLAKKNPSCVPPGHAKRWGRGDILPVNVWQPLPQPLLVQLHPAPVGTQYVRVDQDVFLVSEASKKIIDAVVLLSAVD